LKGRQRGLIIIIIIIIIIIKVCDMRHPYHIIITVKIEVKV